MKLKNYLFLIVALFGFMGSSIASHNTGGQIYWERNLSGQFIFYFEMYADVAPGAAAMPSSITLSSPIGGIPLNAISSASFSGNCASPSYIQGKQVYQSAPVTLTGTPPASGWEFSYSVCCRGSSVANLSTPSSQTIRVTAKMYKAATFVNANGDYPSSPKLIDTQGLLLVNNTTYTLPLVKDNANLDSVSVEFSSLLNLSGNATYDAGYSAITPFGSAPGGSFTPYIDNHNVLRIHTAVQGNYGVGLLAKTYVNGNLYSEQLVDILAEVLPKTAPSNVAPFITIDPISSNVTISTLPANSITGVANVHNVTLAQDDTAQIVMMAFDTIGETVVPMVWNQDHNGLATVGAWDSITGNYKLTINPSHYPGGLPALQNKTFTVFTGSYDYGCNVAGGTMHQFNVTIQPASPCANICMTALDTANMKAYVYIDAPELGNGDIYHFTQYELLGGSSINSVSGTLADKDTILEFPILNINSFNHFAILTDDEVTSGSMVPCDSTGFGNLPVSAVGISPSVNKVTADFHTAIGLSEIRLLSRPVGTSQYNTVLTVSNPVFPNPPYGDYDLYDSLATPGNYEYIVEATPDYQCDTLTMNLKNWIYFTEISNYFPAEATISIKENILNSLSVYPNPTAGIINIPLTNIESTEVMDLSGKLLMKFEKTSQLDLTALNPGVYLLIIRDDAGNVYPTRIQKK